MKGITSHPSSGVGDDHHDHEDDEDVDQEDEEQTVGKVRGRVRLILPDDLWFGFGLGSSGYGMKGGVGCGL